LDQRRLTFEYCLGGAATIVGPFLMRDRVEIGVLILQRVHELVRDRGPQRERIRQSDGNEKRSGIRIVISRHLFVKQRHQPGTQIHGIGY
jgi:hypothetical protein